MKFLRHCLSGACIVTAMAAHGAHATEIVLRGAVTAAVTGGTIAATGVYQTVLNAKAGRRGCTIQNNGANDMSVRPVGAAAAFIVAPGQAFYCGSPAGPVMPNEIELTGTAGDAYTVSAQ